ncbi:MATE family efflux transporter [Spirochaetales bacterium NM-380-WT-3C1]|uniref:Multidrug-efflux transporter n=1 Tax=Bullifex porci TaxID=2606638 RepID=A0A7X2TR49_9SPIO|nr:MATE family efflux transporter [Bullifex porci]MSU06442.1 MATE family efflux transporter [Bullifex porci]
MKGSGSKAKRMTEGSIFKCLLYFALPLMVGNFFQQLYNTVDSIIVGNFVGKEALAAIGSVDSIINTYIGFFVGLSAGAGVVISQYYGASDDENVHKAVHTTIAITLIMAIGTTIISLFTTDIFLRISRVPSDVWLEAETYLGIYFLGLVGLLIYNMGSGILRAVGDSKHPLYFLIFSALSNTVLDIIFVANLRLGVAGAAYATIISQALSALLVLYTLIKTNDCYKISLKKIRIYPKLLKQIFRIGLPTALQMMVTAFSNVFVQSYINSFGSAAMAGYSSYNKIDKVCLLPLQSIGLAITTFMGQNIGAGNSERAIKGVKTATRMNVVTAIVLLTFLWVVAPYLIYIFNQDEEVIHYGTIFLRTMSPFFLCVAYNQIHNGALKGAGNTKIPMIIMMSCFIVFRQIYLFVISRVINTPIAIALGYPLGWLLCTIILSIYYKKVDITAHSVLSQK